MLDDAYLDNNNKGSLESRIFLCWQIMEASDQIIELNQWKDDIPVQSSAYGTLDEMIEAQTVFENTKIMLHEIVDQEDIRLALKQGILTENEAWKISKERERAIAKQEAKTKKNSRKR